LNNVKNAMSIDLEDWFCSYTLSKYIKREGWGNCELRIVQSTNKILDLLKKYNTKATFFVLGWIAEQVPDLISEIEKLGHEIATHGYSHTLLTQMTPKEFEEDLRKALDVTRKCISQKIQGFRAPRFSITKKTMWAADILVKNGIKYDSSIFSFGFNTTFKTPLFIHKLNSGLTEVPLSSAEYFGIRIPCSGGVFFRFFPYPFIRTLIKRCNIQKRPVVFYLHPWEVDPGQPKIKAPFLKRFRHYFNQEGTMRKLERLLNDFEFTSIKDVLRI